VTRPIYLTQRGETAPWWVRLLAAIGVVRVMDEIEYYVREWTGRW
jgi:hypothetical protein